MNHHDDKALHDDEDAILPLDENSRHAAEGTATGDDGDVPLERGRASSGGAEVVDATGPGQAGIVASPDSPDSAPSQR